MRTVAVAVAAAFLFFLYGGFLVIASAQLFTQYFYDPRLIAIAHVFTLGWISLMIAGVLRQLAPIAFGVQAEASPLFGVATGLWIAGTLGLVAGFWFQAFRVAAVGVALVFAAAMALLHLLAKPFFLKRTEYPHRHVLASFLFLAATAFLGLTMAFAKGFSMPLPFPIHRILFAHIHLGAAGWVGLMILGVLSRLFPQPQLKAPAAAKWRFGLFVAGLCGLAVGLIVGAWWTPVFGGLLAFMSMWYTAAFVPVLWRFRGAHERSTLFLISALLCFAMTAAMGLAFAATPIGYTEFGMRLQLIYGLVYLLGWVSLTILGMLFRIIPTQISKLLASRGIAASAMLRRRLENPKLQTVVLILLLTGLAVASAGILQANAAMFRAGWSLWLGGILGFLAGLARLGVSVRQAIRKTAR